jgi:hypothetical protein
VINDADHDALWGKYQSALVKYMWLLDNGIDADPDAEAVITVHVPRAVAKLGEKYPPAITELALRESRAETELRGGRVRARWTVRVYAACANAMKRPEDVAQTFWILIRDPGAPVDTRVQLYREVLDSFATSRTDEDTTASRNRLLDFLHRGVAFNPEEARHPRLIAEALEKGGEIFAALVRLGRDAEAKVFANQILAESPSVEAFAHLIRASRYLHREDLERDLRERAHAVLEPRAQRMLDEPLRK